MDAPLPSVASQASFESWGRGSGLHVYDGDSEKATAKRWKQELLEGVPGTPSLLSRNQAGATTFVCSSRLAVLEFIAPRLSLLDAGKLEDRDNCCVVFGTRELGKSTFLSSIAHVVALEATPTTAVISVNFKTDGISEPAHLLQRLMAVPLGCVRALCHPVIATGDPMPDISAVLQSMVDCGRRALLLIDDVEALFRHGVDPALAARVFRQLCVMGRWSGTRPIVVVLTGSAAALRSLLFCDASSDIALEFPLHLHFGSLNYSQFVPLALQPMVHASAVQRAILSLSGGKELYTSLVRSGGIITPAAAVSVGADPIAQGCTVDPALLERIVLRSRGIAGHIIADCHGSLRRDDSLERLFGAGCSPDRVAVLQRVVAGWED